MKRYLMLVLAVLLLSSAAHAQTQGYLGLFTSQDRTSWCSTPPQVPWGIDMYMMALPSTAGFKCAEFAIDYAPESTNLRPLALTPNPSYTVLLGDIYTGLSICFDACQTTWFYVAVQMLLVYDLETMYTMSIQPHSGTGHVYFADCGDPRTTYDAIPFTNFYVNATDGVDPECGQTAATPASWGAIKSLYN